MPIGRAAGLLIVTMRRLRPLRFAVSDNGIGSLEGQLNLDKTTPGLGTIIVEALAKRLDARVVVASNPQGTTVSITHGTSDRAWPPLIGTGGCPLPDERRLRRARCRGEN